MMLSSILSVDSKAQGAAEGAKKSLGREDFLNLLITQMRFQDPLKPMDNTEFTAQLAQFSSLDQLFSINNRLEGLTGNQQAFGNAQAVGFLGTEIKANGNHLFVRDGQASPIGFQLSKAASEVQVRVFDPAGGKVRTLELSGGPIGNFQTTWDGMDDKGKRVPAGEYSFEVSALDLSGAEVPVSPTMSGRVSGISYDSSGMPNLIVGNMRIPVKDVLEVKTGG